ncbi:hypothetical protein [Nonomuraea jabiensis]|uniref:Uncharacterized protein n=1 Tax=Nonomuraea jabiensis TaxID=882448 RepID=A0A7W9G3J7_9ACTN|nr:hypothetical protein [Nonomuraea jabiensis]MBB5776595.1 hypothetical protein [Nonomuraea jabiensis]
MPKLVCPCGYVHDLSPIPDAGYVTFLDELSDAILHPGAEELDSDERMGLLIFKTGLLYECPDCGRVMWRKDYDATFRIYMPDDL